MVVAVAAVGSQQCTEHTEQLANWNNVYFMFTSAGAVVVVAQQNYPYLETGILVFLKPLLLLLLLLF